MGSETNQKAGHYFKGLMKKAQEAIKLVIGNSEIYTEEDTGGHLKFNPNTMMKINVTFDKDFLPKEKVVKLNVRGNQFFHNLKRNIREINGIYIIYPHEYEIQLDVRRDQWEKRLISELNEEYQLTLKKIHFVSEEEVCKIYQRKGITHIQNPYNLKRGELLIIAGGFANFNTEGESICSIKVNLTKETNNNGKTKESCEENYYGKYSPYAGAYFFVGGEWYHNLFIPELYHPEEPRFFSFRIADDGKNLKFFSDLKKRGIDIRAHVKTKTETDYERIIYTINLEYLPDTGIKDFKLSITYDIKEEEESHDKTTINHETVPETLPPQKFPGVDLHVQTQEMKAEEDTLPYLESEMILLPSPKEDDISSYMMTIGDEKKSVKFYANSIDQEVSILAPGKEEKIYKRKINDSIDYAIKLDSIYYAISNIFLSRIDNRTLKLYFAWELITNVIERTCLGADFYIFGREPLDDSGKQAPETAVEQLIRLNKGEEEFWRIGTSRDHGLLVKEKTGDTDRHCLYNISLSYPIYLIKSPQLEEPLVQPSVLAPVSGREKQEKCAAFLAKLKEAVSNGSEPLDISDWLMDLKEFAEGKVLENNERVIIGNRVFKYIVPLAMETTLSDRAQKSILRKVQITQSILRK